MTPEEFEKLYINFLKWYAMPVTSREPHVQTIEEWCANANVDKSTVAEFQHVPTFTDDLCREAVAWGKSKIPDLLHMLHAKYKESKNPNDLRMFKELLAMDKPTKAEKDSDNSSAGVLRELFNASR